MSLGPILLTNRRNVLKFSCLSLGSIHYFMAGKGGGLAKISRPIVVGGGGEGEQLFFSFFFFFTHYFANFLFTKVTLHTL